MERRTCLGCRNRAHGKIKLIAASRTGTREEHCIFPSPSSGSKTGEGAVGKRAIQTDPLLALYGWARNFGLTSMLSSACARVGRISQRHSEASPISVD